MSVRKIIVTAFSVLIVQAGQAMADETLAKRAGCLECHSAEKKIIGPAFHDIAARYKGNPRARETLKEKVKNGGKGNWTEISGGVPMPPHSGLLSDGEIRTLVDWVLNR